jgi:hypothetical protein
MNLSEHSEDKELFSETLVKENTMNLSEYSEDKELFSETLMNENIETESEIESKIEFKKINGKKSIIFHSNIKKLGLYMNKFSEDEIKNEPMFYRSSYDFVINNCGPIMNDFLSKVPKKFLTNCLIDSRSHMLMEGFWPCIPGWHHDDVPRTLPNKQPDYRNINNNAKFIMALVNSSLSPTEFLIGNIILPDIKTKIYKRWNPIINKEINEKKINSIIIDNDELIYFDNNTIHQGTRATKFGWRWFVRLTVNSTLKPENEIRKQVQIYLDDYTIGW